MTKKLLLLLLIVGMSFAACSQDDDEMEEMEETMQMEEVSDSAKLIGEWLMTSYEYTGVTTVSSQGEMLTTDFSGSAKDITYVLEFREDNTFTSSGGYVITLTTIQKEQVIAGQTIPADTIVQDVPLETPETTGNWELANGMIEGISFSDGQIGGETGELEILELTDSRLKINADFEETSAVSGATTIVQVDGEIVFEKM